MIALAPAFRSVDYIAGLNLNYRKGCWVLHGTEERDSLRTWISEKCEEFREMQSVRHAKYFGTMMAQMETFIGGRHPENFIQRVLAKTLVERFCDFKIYSISVLSFFLDPHVHLIRQPSRPRTMLFSVHQQARTTLYRLLSLELAPYVVLVTTWWVFTESALRSCCMLDHA